MRNFLFSGLDIPENNERGFYRFAVSGWVLPFEAMKTFSLYVDGTSVRDFKVQRTRRPDIQSAFPKIDGAADSGFKGIITLGSAEGEHDLQIGGVTEDGDELIIGRRKIINSAQVISDPPRKVSIGLLSLCNLRCMMCPKHSPTLSYPCQERIMDPVLVEKILSELRVFSPSVQQIGLQDYGEPLLYKDLFRIISAIEERFPCTIINLTTNGTVMDETIIGKILGSKNSVITVSLDAATEETYRQIRGGGNFQVVTGNIKKILARRKKNQLSKPVIATNFVITRSNFHEIPRYISLSSELGVDYAGFVHPFGLFESDKEDPVYCLDGEETTYGRTFLTIKKEIESSVPGSMVHPPIPGITPDEGITDCLFGGKSSMIIDTEGRVFPCCVLAAKYYEPESPVREMGDVRTQSLLEIWESDDFKRFRENFFTGRIPHPICEQCPKYYGI